MARPGWRGRVGLSQFGPLCGDVAVSHTDADRQGPRPRSRKDHFRGRGHIALLIPRIVAANFPRGKVSEEPMASGMFSGDAGGFLHGAPGTARTDDYTDVQNKIQNRKSPAWS
ncbi:hypothetical protein MTO96_003979 [Rhipicephalus appendiculatus]